MLTLLILIQNQWQFIARTSCNKYVLLAKGNRRIAFNTVDKNVTHSYEVKR